MKPDYDPVAVFTALATLLVGQKLGPVFGAYTLMVIMATSGALVALGRREPDRKPSGIVFILIVNCIAVGFTTLLSTLVAAKLEGIEARSLFAPIAFALGMVGLDYPVLIPYIYSKYVEWRRGGKDGT